MCFVGIHSFNIHINAMKQVLLSHSVTTPLLVPVLIPPPASAPLLLQALLLPAHTCCPLQKLALRLLEPFCSKTRARDNLSNDLTAERVQRWDPLPPEAQTLRYTLDCRAAQVQWSWDFLHQQSQSLWLLCPPSLLPLLPLPPLLLSWISWKHFINKSLSLRCLVLGLFLEDQPTQCCRGGNWGTGRVSHSARLHS